MNVRVPVLATILALAGAAEAEAGLTAHFGGLKPIVVASGATCPAPTGGPLAFADLAARLALSDTALRPHP